MRTVGASLVGARLNYRNRRNTMAWKADGYVTIGKSHRICQDYVLADSRHPTIIVCDGCSSSSHSDLGARLLAHSGYQTLNTGGKETGEREFGNKVIKRAKTCLETLNPSLTEDTLDATLLAATIRNGRLLIYMYGDGIAVRIKINGEYEITRMRAAHNAPHYLSYQIDKKRELRYRKQFPCDDTKQANNQTLHTNTITTNDCGVLLEADASLYRAVALFSDGIESFIDQNSGATYEYHRFVNTALRFKLHSGAFLQRRVHRELRLLARANIIHHDDIGTACLLRA